MTSLKSTENGGKPSAHAVLLARPSQTRTWAISLGEILDVSTGSRQRDGMCAVDVVEIGTFHDFVFDPCPIHASDKCEDSI
jgi:hypothetical protein